VIIARVAGRITLTIVRDVVIHTPIARACIISKIGVSIGAKGAMNTMVHTARIATNTIVMSVKVAKVAVAIG
jgi:hypothetical protein